MKNRVNLFRRMAAVALGAAMLASCAQEEQIDLRGTLPGGDGEVAFTVSVPDGTTLQTRGIDEKSEADNALHDLAFLLFDYTTETYVDYAVATYISAPTAADASEPANKNRYTVRAKLPLGRYKALVVANWGRLQGIGLPAYMETRAKPVLTGKTITQIAERESNAGSSVLFRYNGFPDGGDFTATHACFPMGGRCVIPEDRSTLPTIGLTRSLAKINVTVADGTSGDPLTLGSGMTKFELKTIRLIHAGTQAMVLPPATAGALNLPASPATIGEMGITYTVPAEKKASFVDEIFLPETPVPANADDFEHALASWKTAVALLIEADLGTGGVRWFRLNLRMPDVDDADADGDTDELKHVEILRNRRYHVHITGVRGSRAGYDTPEEAYDALPNDLIRDLEVSDDELDNIVYNGQYYLATNQLKVFESWEWHDISAHTPNLQDVLKVRTNYPGGWKVEKIEYIDNGTYPDTDNGVDVDTDWITTVFPTTPIATPTQAYEQLLAVKTNHGPTRHRTAILTIAAGAMSTTVTVEQKPGGFLASPGVIGLSLESGELTLSGSREYANTPIETYSEFGPLSEETVYVTYFKGGSLIAIGGNSDKDLFDPSDIVGAPSIEDGYIGLEAWRERVSSWADIPFMSPNQGWVMNPEEGLGDPCVYYFDGFNGQDWLLPTGGYANGGWNGGSFGNVSSANDDGTANMIPWATVQATMMSRSTMDDLAPGLPLGAHPGIGAASDWSMFLPVAGRRSSESGGGMYFTDYMFGYGEGHYWSSTIYASNGQYNTFNGLFFGSKLNGANPGVAPTRILSSVAHGLAVRCVKFVPTIEVDPESIPVNNVVGSEWNVKVISDTDWELVSAPDWCEVLTTEGPAGETVVVIKITERNPNTLVPRPGEIKFQTKGGEDEAILTVTQPRYVAPNLSAPDKAVNWDHITVWRNPVSAQGGTEDDWIIEKIVVGGVDYYDWQSWNGWATIVENNGATEYVDITPKTMLGYNDLNRSFYVHLYSPSTDVRTRFQFTQLARDAFNGFGHASLIFKDGSGYGQRYETSSLPPELFFGCEGAWTITMHCSWIHFPTLSGTGNCRMVMTVDPNPGTTERYGDFTVRHTASGQEIRCTVSQWGISW